MNLDLRWSATNISFLLPSWTVISKRCKTENRCCRILWDSFGAYAARRKELSMAHWSGSTDSKYCIWIFLKVSSSTYRPFPADEISIITVSYCFPCWQSKITDCVALALLAWFPILFPPTERDFRPSLSRIPFPPVTPLLYPSQSGDSDPHNSRSASSLKQIIENRPVSARPSDINRCREAAQRTDESAM